MSGAQGPHSRRRRLWVLGCVAVAVAVTLPLQAGAAALIMMLLPHQDERWHTVALESATPAMRNAGLLLALAAAAATVAFIVWLLAWVLRELVSGLRPHGADSDSRRGTADTADAGEAVT